jgi:hypothetical protein
MEALSRQWYPIVKAADIRDCQLSARQCCLVCRSKMRHLVGLVLAVTVA